MALSKDHENFFRELNLVMGMVCNLETFQELGRDEIANLSCQAVHCAILGVSIHTDKCPVHPTQTSREALEREAYNT